MGPMDGREIAERDQLWASLRALRPEIDRLAAGETEPADNRQRQLVQLLASVIAAEMDYRLRDAATE
ncbi:MAG: hypothetical protein JWO38_4489 [Gemmataceae bacterium]|nr:hypothetical protein [Gemmataceae bacterium]